MKLKFDNIEIQYPSKEDITDYDEMYLYYKEGNHYLLIVSPEGTQSMNRLMDDISKARGIYSLQEEDIWFNSLTLRCLHSLAKFFENHKWKLLGNITREIEFNLLMK